MSIFKDIMDTIQNSVVGDAANTILDNIGRKAYRSIHERANEGTLQFPHIVSRSNDLSVAQMVIKASERNLATFVQIAMSLSPNLYIEDGTDAATYIKQFHSNLKGPFSGVKSGATLVALLEEGYLGFIQNEGMLAVTSVYNDTTKEIMVSNESQLRDVIKDLNDKVLNIPTKEVHIYNFNMEAKGNSNTFNNYNDNRVRNTTTNDNHSITNVDSSNRMKNSQNTYTNYNINVTNPVDKNNKNNQTNLKNLDVSLISGGKMLADNDAKKANELVSTLVHVRIKLLSKENGTELGYHDFVIGVKGIMHLVTSEEVVDNLVRAYRGENEVFNFLRWTTGEISFMKDFLLNINNIKRDVLARTAGASPIWISAKRAKRLAAMNNFFSKSKMLPNVIMVVTREEVNYIKEVHGIDFFNLRNVDMVMDKLYLLGFIIVDSAAEAVHFKYESAMDWEVVSFDGLEKENAKDERKFKDMLKALNR